MGSGPLFQRPDRRVSELVSAYHAESARRPHRLVADPFRHALLYQIADGPPAVSVGVVVFAYPAYGWYRVQLGGGQGTIPCCALAAGNLGSVGARSAVTIAPNTPVLVYRARESPWGVIIGALPLPVTGDNPLRRTWTVQGSRAGVGHEAMYRDLVRLVTDAGWDFGAAAPLDATRFDWDVVTETGVAVHVDPALAFIRASDACGLWVTPLDEYARLAAPNLDIWTAAEQTSVRWDEGELRLVRQHFVYPWEAVGRPFGPGPLGRSYPPEEVQFRRGVADYDLEAGERGVQGVSRRCEYGGYLGQGGMRQVSCPPPSAGWLRRTGDGVRDVGLFRESIALDGSALWESAKGLYFVKRPRIVVPRERYTPEDARGDDGKRGGYAFSSHFGSGGRPHRPGEWGSRDTPRSLLQAAAVLDVLAHHWNWKALHPFHYHAGDFDLPEEAQTPGFDRVQDQLDFTPLATGGVVADPTPRRLRIDHRYGDVDYYQRCAFFALTDDGSVVLGSGCGGQLVLAGGHAYLEAAGEIRLRSGRRVLAMSRDVILRAHGSVDVSAATGEVRLAAHRKLQLLGQSLLLHAKGRASVYSYRNRVGEDVISSGVVVKSNSDYVVLARDVYLRSGITPDPGGGYATADGPVNPAGGHMVLDAGQGRTDVVVRADQIRCLAAAGLTVWSHPGEGNWRQCHVLGPHEAQHSTPLIVRGPIVGCGDSGLTIQGPVAATGAIVSGQRLAHRGGPRVDTVPAAAIEEIRRACDRRRQALEALLPAGAVSERQRLDLPWCGPERPGHDAVVPLLQFSFRDDPDGRQYGTTELRFVESRWEQLARVGLATGVVPWDEPALEYQGRRLRAYPGEAAWNRPCFYRLRAHVLFDPAAGVSRPRGPAYEQPDTAAWDRVPLSEGLRVVTG